VCDVMSVNIYYVCVCVCVCVCVYTQGAYQLFLTSPSGMWFIIIPMPNRDTAYSVCDVCVCVCVCVCMCIYDVCDV